MNQSANVWPLARVKHRRRCHGKRTKRGTTVRHAQRRQDRLYYEPLESEGPLGGFPLPFTCGHEEGERKGHVGGCRDTLLGNGSVYPFLFFSFKRYDEKKVPPSTWREHISCQGALLTGLGRRG